MTDWKRLTEPFAPGDVEWRVAQAGVKGEKIWAKVLAYITSRAIQERLDEVFGPGGWKNEYRAGPSGGVVCRIYFRNDDGEWVWREDGAENTDIEAVKGGISGSLKRAGAALGIGRYLYHLPEGWANVHERGQFSAKTKEGKWFRWDPPELPPWALPDPRPTVPAKALPLELDYLDLLMSHDVFNDDEREAVKRVTASGEYEAVQKSIARAKAALAERTQPVPV